MTPRLEMAAVSDRGMLRAGNEDHVAVNPAIGLAVLADGMGGHNAGEVASGMAVESIVADALGTVDTAARLDADGAQSLIRLHVRSANSRIHGASLASRERSGMGTTVVAALWHDAQVTVGHVGDSRFYRLRGAELTRLTRDHTLIQQGIDAGALTAEQARVAPGRNILTRALGTEEDVDVDLATHDAEPDDLYLLCSDGLTEMLDDDEIARVLAQRSTGLRALADELIRLANQNGGVDNVSVVLVRAAVESTRT